MGWGWPGQLPPFIYRLKSNYMGNWKKRWFAKNRKTINTEAVPPTGSVPVLPGIAIYSSERAARILWLESQIEISRKFVAFAEAAYQRGYALELFLAVDGQIAPASVMVGPSMKEVVKYLAECAAGSKHKYHAELDFLKKGGDLAAWRKVEEATYATWHQDAGHGHTSAGRREGVDPGRTGIYDLDA